MGDDQEVNFTRIPEFPKAPLNGVRRMAPVSDIINGAGGVDPVPLYIFHPQRYFRLEKRTRREPRKRDVGS